MADFVRVTVPLIVISLLSYLIWRLLFGLFLAKGRYLPTTEDQA